MVEKIGNFIVELVGPPGTGSFTLGGSGAPGRSPWSAGVAAGYFVPPAQVLYIANDTTRQEWGIGTYTAGQLTRDTVLWTSAGSTAKINFSTLPVYVYPDIPAERSVYRDPTTGRLIAPYDISSPTQNQGQLAGHRNRLINSGFQVNQIGYASGGGNGAAFQYTIFDRWRTGPAGLSGIGWAPNAQLPALQIAINGSIQQVIDGANIEGGTYTLSWQGSTKGRVNAGAFSSSPLTVTGIVAGANTTIEFNSGFLLQPQFEPGDTATAWEMRLNEQKLCMRYKVFGNFRFVQNANSASIPLWYSIGLPTTMRAQPTVSASPDAYATNVSSSYFATALGNRDIQVQTTVVGSGPWNFSGAYLAIAEI